MSDQSWKSGDKPSSYGAILGDALALIAAAGRRDMPPGTTIADTCLTCAFREGALPNRMGGTTKMALDCVLGIDRDRFACHHGSILSIEALLALYALPKPF